MTTFRDNEARVTLLDRCRELRRKNTGAEALLWRFLRARQVAGAKFRRQHQFGPYILDFYCNEARLVVEVDGAQHEVGAQASTDVARTRYLEECGLQVIRFTNLDVLSQTESVLMRIWDAVAPSPQPFPTGRGARLRFA